MSFEPPHLSTFSSHAYSVCRGRNREKAAHVQHFVLSVMTLDISLIEEFNFHNLVKWKKFLNPHLRSLNYVLGTI